MPQELVSLVNRCLAGQQTAQLDFVRRFQGQIYGFCYRMLGQREDAEDCTQETFIRVLRNLHRWDSTRKIEPWLLTIAGNRCRTRLSLRSRRPTSHSLEIPIEDRTQLYQRADLLAEEIQLALGELRSEYRDAFLLFHEKELAYDEIAKQLDVPLGTVKTWVHRARREIVQKLAKRGVVQESRSELPAIRSASSAAAG